MINPADPVAAVRVPQEPPARPKIICLCGSTRFIEQFAVQTWELELQGHIVLGCTLLPSWYCPVRDHFAETLGVKPQRDEHHLRKIDLADEVLVLNIGGYIGESTRNEITYATAQGKPVRYLESDTSAAPLVAPAGVPEPQTWQPIETAPQRSRVLIYVPEVDHFISGVFTAVLIGLTGRWVIAGGGGPLVTQPTLWAPLPDPSAVGRLPALPQPENACPHCQSVLKFNEWNGAVCPHCQWILAERTTGRLPALEALLHAARLLALSLTPDMLESLRPEYGNTNVAVLTQWQAAVLEGLAGLRADPAPLQVLEEQDVKVSRGDSQ